MSALTPFLQRLPQPSSIASALRSEAVSKLLPVVFLAIALTALVMMFVWQNQSNYRPLFGARENVPSADMMSVLDAEGIAYRLHPDTGQVLVAESNLGRARMLLAARGVVARLPDGLELMDKSDPLGVTQFVQDVRFRRGLEGELVQSITALEPVKSARVHLSIARSSTFVLNATEASSASVVVHLHPGRELEAEQIASIIKLVSGSVSNLAADRVTVVDQAGRLLSSRVDIKAGLDSAGFANEAQRKAQEALLRNAHQLLQPVLGVNNYNVSASVELHQDNVKETQERYEGDPRITSEASREEMNRQPQALGIPGSLSNRPANPPPDEEDKPGTAERSAATRQYAYDRSVTTIERARGQVKKISVAVVLNNAAAPAGATAWAPAEIARMEQVLRGGLGIDTARGDQLVVSAMAFPTPPAAVAWYAEPQSIFTMTGWALSAVGALLAYLLIARPLIRRFTRDAAPPREVGTSELVALGPRDGEGAAVVAGALPAGAVAALPQPARDQNKRDSMGSLLENYNLPPPGSPVDVLVDHLRDLATKEPERVAEVVKQWVQKNGHQPA
ncbi:flagellar basal-body MS-ring/collar protein FliF [uncultured Hydrogenophaga sp.]|uniref:flagellar basal-body MS-ring/collar protein FliF n=1 Tax=uncultured Hydrogenophaga sp. TaxID=199683 RepID=UPI002584CBC3|nr:flagellar basal-body MS-ring/collar protein FliF [uncultured Hydrogenophaga sp.]